jgi:hypothetical protein
MHDLMSVCGAFEHDVHASLTSTKRVRPPNHRKKERRPYLTTPCVCPMAERQQLHHVGHRFTVHGEVQSDIRDTTHILNITARFRGVQIAVRERSTMNDNDQTTIPKQGNITLVLQHIISRENCLVSTSNVKKSGAHARLAETAATVNPPTTHTRSSRQFHTLKDSRRTIAKPCLNTRRFTMEGTVKM